jgi:hypothetical protein
VHPQADEACRVACERAGATIVLLQDRYHRVRELVGASSR